jgi:hypothetical protein
MGPIVETGGDREGAAGGSCNGGACRCSAKIWRSTGSGIVQWTTWLRALSVGSYYFLCFPYVAECTLSFLYLFGFYFTEVINTSIAKEGCMKKKNYILYGSRVSFGT